MTRIATVEGARVNTSFSGLQKIVDGATVSQSASKFVLDVGPENMTFAGSGMTYDAGDVTGGTIIRIASASGLLMNALSVSASALFDTVQAHDAAGLADLLFSGKDKITGGNLGDALSGYAGNDVLIGNAGNDTIEGGEGKDRITGGVGRDLINGGAGADTFVYSALSDSAPSDKLQQDNISDLTNLDRIDVSGIDADVTQAGDQAFHLLSGNNFTGHAGEVVLRYAAGYNVGSILFDVNGDGASDMTILLSGDHRDFTNFVL
jgi:Ca2+-binding RTX toxin-like protein